MDIQHLVDRLEDLIDEGRHIFGTKYTLVDEERALELIDQMRISVPEEIEKSSRILTERDRIRAEAHEEAARIVQQAREKSQVMIEREASVESARRRAEEIIAQANQEARRITNEADAYVMQTLGKLEQELIRNLGEIRNWIAMLQDQASQDAETPTQHQPVHIPQPLEHETVRISIDGNTSSD